MRSSPPPSNVQEPGASCNDERIHSFGVVLEAMAQLNRTFDRSLKESVGVSQSTFEGLLRLERSGGELTMGALTDQISLTSGGVTRLVSRLVEHGYAQRRACETDRRVQYVSITDDGRRALSAAIEVHLADLEAHFTGVMSGEERATIVAVMERIREKAPD